MRWSWWLAGVLAVLVVGCLLGAVFIGEIAQGGRSRERNANNFKRLWADAKKIVGRVDPAGARSSCQ